MPKNNMWAIAAAGVATVLVAVLDALLKFFATGQPWPVNVEGWLQILLPALCAGLIAVLTPHYSLSEQRTGQRVIDSGRGDAPVLDLSAPDRVVNLPSSTDSPGVSPSV